MGQRIGIGSDHAGKELKHLVGEYLRMSGHTVVDYGVPRDQGTSVDYPDIAALLSGDVAEGKVDGGVLVCGTGIGMSIVANKFPGVRAAVVWDEFSSRMAKAHNNANVICLGARTLNHDRAGEFVKCWLDTPFESGRHQMRVEKIREIEKRQLRLRGS